MTETPTVDLGDGVTMEFVRIMLPKTTVETDTHVLFMGRTEVSNAQYRQFRPRHNSTRWDRRHIIAYQDYINSLRPEFDDDGQPAVYVPWEEATAFAAWLSKKSGHAVRLPTEAEWEFACRAGTTTEFSWGDEPDQAKLYANTNDPITATVFKFGEPFPGDDGYRVTAPVGSFEPNSFGLFDMHGNVAEWTLDVWREPVLGPLTDDGSDPGDPQQRVVKGGDFTCGPNGEAYFGCECQSRSWNYLGNANFGTGFRVVIELNQGERERSSPQVEVLQGFVLEKRANTKSYAAWNAPSYVYYVLDLGAVIVTLRPSQLVSTADLQRFKGKRVSVCGHHVEGKTYQPQKGEPYPIVGGRPAKRGSGFVVTEITRLNE